MNSQEIVRAIGAHSLWKQRLADTIKSRSSDTTPEGVQVDNNLCDFGKWLGSLSPKDRNAEHFKKVQALHAAFHQEAAHVLKLALTGQKAEAEKSLAFGGAYARLSLDLINAMMAWKLAIDR